VKIYLAGPLFSPAQRGFLEGCARSFREVGLECFLPHEQEAGLTTLSARTVFELDCKEGLEKANALVAWLDGPNVDDGTACEIGIYHGLLREGAPWRKGILGLVTDLRLERRREVLEHGGLNLFLAGAVESAGRICWGVDEATTQLLAWKSELDGAGA